MRKILPILMLSLLAGCMTQPEPGPSPEPPAPVPEQPDLAESSVAMLVGTTWSLVEIQSMDDSLYKPEGRNLYTLEFLEDGNLLVRADCNRGRGSWRGETRSRLVFGPIASTRAFCGAESLHDRFLSNLSYVRSYVMQDGELYLATMADGAILRFKPAGPDFDCDKADGSVQEMICSEPELSTLDRKLNGVFVRALRRAAEDEKKTLRAIQRGWIKGRDDCWKSTDVEGCVRFSYESRITGLQIAVADTLVPAPVVYHCEDDETISAYFYSDTQIPSLVLNRYPDQVILYREPAASGAKYQGQNVTFWDKAGHAILEDFDVEPRRCNITSEKAH